MEEKRAVSNDARGAHGHMNHGLGMMLIGCGIPLAAILFLPAFGVSSTVSFVVAMVGMFGIHGGMMAIQKARKRRQERPSNAAVRQ